MPYFNKNRQRQYQREWLAKRRNDFFKDKECDWCKSKSKLELHHLDSSEKTSHNIWSWSKERREKEISKCIVLCEKCHQDVTTAERYKIWPHGTVNRYESSCRCIECVTVMRSYWKSKR